MAAMNGSLIRGRFRKSVLQETTMTEVAAPAPAPAAPAQTVGQALDADVAALKARGAVLEGNV